MIDSYLVDAQWLSAHLEQPQVVIVDCRFALSEPDLGRQQYEAGHIPGAYYLDLNRDLSGPVQAHGGRHPLPDWQTFVRTLNQLGIFSKPPQGPTQVIAYDDSQFAFAARLWWLLRYLGHEQVALLDGGFEAWKAAGLPLSTGIPEPKAGDFKPQPQPDWTVDIETVRQRKDQPGVLLIDSRAEGRFRGEYEPIDPIAGSVPSAVNYFWQDVVDDSGRLKSPAELANHWSDLDSADEVIVYCGSGVTACVNLFSQAIAHKPMGKLYPGGWSDWSSYLT
nr:sulfurtransferase [Romeria gracilis]